VIPKKEKSPMKTQTFEDVVAATAATVADWRTKITSIQTQIAAENHTIAIAKQHRERHALSSTLGDSHAIAAIEKARADQYGGEQRLADLSIALPEAQAKLAAAERAATAARHELAMLRAESKKRARIAAAGRLDEALSACAAGFCRI
jgi:hypothetical protein